MTARALLESAGCTGTATDTVEQAGAILIASLARLQQQEAYLIEEGQRFTTAAQKMAELARKVLRNDIMICWGGAVTIAALYMTTKRYIEYYLRDNKTLEIRTRLAQQATRAPSEGSIIGCALSIIEYCADRAVAITDNREG